MTGAEALDAALEPRPLFRGPLANQRPRIVRTFGAIPGWCWRLPRWSSLGLVMVFNVSWFPGGDDFGDPLHFFRKHVISIGIGVVLLRGRHRGSARTQYRRLAYPLLGVALVLHGRCPDPRHRRRCAAARGAGSRFGPLTFQPSELTKLALVLFLARSLARAGDRVRKLGTRRAARTAWWWASSPLLCLAEPDFGTAALAGVLLVLDAVRGGRAARCISGMFAPRSRCRRWSGWRWRRRTGGGVWRRSSTAGRTRSATASSSARRSSPSARAACRAPGSGRASRRCTTCQPRTPISSSRSSARSSGWSAPAWCWRLFAAVAARGFRIAARHPDDFGSLLAFGLTSLIVVQGAAERRGRARHAARPRASPCRSSRTAARR